MLLRDEPVAGACRLTLNRPAQRNALCSEFIDELLAALQAAASDDGVRLLMLAARGDCFCAGGDRAELRRIAAGDEALNQRQAAALATLLLAVFEFPKPVLALVDGPAIGAGVGLVAAADIGIATPAARFAMPEARLGLVSAVVSPYLVHALGERAARRWLLTGENMTVDEAKSSGLVHECVPSSELLPRALAMAADIVAGDAVTLVTTKQMLRGLAGRTPDHASAMASADALASHRRLQVVSLPERSTGASP